MLCLLLVLVSPTADGYLTDTSVHTEPALPTLTNQNDHINDPVFGTQITRITTNSDSSTDCQVGYSNRPAFNVNNTYIGFWCRVSGSQRFIVWNWDKTTNTVSNKRQQSNRQAQFQDYGVQWSKTTYNKYYACANQELYEVTVPDGTSTTFTNTMIKDFQPTIGGTNPDNCSQISVSNDDDIFAMHYSKASVREGYIVWKRSTNTILLHVNTEGSINEVEIDKSGQYLVALTDANDLYVWDLNGTPSRTTVTTEFFNHRGMGWGVVASSCTLDRVCKRNLATPNTVTYLQSGVDRGTGGAHYSLTGPDDYVIASFYTSPHADVTMAYENEIFGVALNGSGVRRWAHHRAHSFSGDPHPPYANSSMDGRYVAFVSNWDAADTNVGTHVYVLDLYPPGPSTGARMLLLGVAP